jgi:hypothetical protein
MKRTVFLFLLVFICVVPGGIVLGQSVASSGAKKVCPISIVGTWKPEPTTEANPIFLSFSPEGWVNLLGSSAETSPQDFDVIAQVKYRLDTAATPKRIDFTAIRGNDVFPPVTTSMVIAEYNDESFTMINPESWEQSRWIRVQTHRYFLTFAARSGTLQQSGPAFAMWTRLDGRTTETEALGIQQTKDIKGKTVPVFGPIPAELSNEFTTESDKESDVMMRLELTEAEYERTHRVFETAEQLAKNKPLLHDNPYLRVIEFLESATESLNQCGERLKISKPDSSTSTSDRISSKRDLAQRPVEFIRSMRKNNDKEHITNGGFPVDWRPVQPSSDR